MHAFRGARRAGAACLLLMWFMFIWLGALAVIGREVWPRAEGEKIIRNNGLIVDISNASDGYIMVRSEPGAGKLKLRISRGDTIYTYDLNDTGEYEVFPLQMGSGEYICSLYKNLKDNRYAKEAEVCLSVELSSEHAAFLCPSQYVDYTDESLAVKHSREICAGLETDAEKLEAIRDFMVKGFAYDYVRALTSSGSYLGDVDGCFETRMGLCQDLSAVAASMLRVQGIPTQLVIGYADEKYHAWNHVLVGGEYHLLDVTAALSGMPGDTVYTAERFY